MKVRLLVIFILLVVVIGLSAVPFGTLGNIDTPDGYVMASRQFSINIGAYYRTKYVDKGNNIWGDDGAEFATTYQFRYGLWDRAEVGLVYTSDEYYYVNMKYQLFKETPTTPVITLGVDNLFSKVPADIQKAKADLGPDEHEKWEEISNSSEYEKNSFYVTLSKSLKLSDVPVLGKLQVYGTIGLGSNRFVGQRDLAKDFNGFFASIQYFPTEWFPKNNFSLFGEMSGHAINLGFNYEYSNFAVRAGILTLEEFIKENDENLTYAINFGYIIDSFSQQKGSTREVYDYISQEDAAKGPNYVKKQKVNISKKGVSDLLQQIKALRNASAQKEDKVNDLIDELDEE